MTPLRSALLRGVAACGLLSAIGATPAVAQDAQTETLPTVTVEGQAAPEVLTSTTTRNQLEQQQVDNIEDFGRRIDAGINYDANTRSVNLRGLGENRVLTTVDGIRVPWLDQGARADTLGGGVGAVDFDSLSSIDVIRGADSSTRGSGALAGTIALKTLTPEDLLFDGKNFGGLFKGSYDSSDESWRTSLALAARYNDTLFLVQGGYREGHEDKNRGEVEGYGASRSEKNPSDYDRVNGLITVHQYLGNGHRFGITGEHFKDSEDIDVRTQQSATAAGTYGKGGYLTEEVIERDRVSAAYDYVSNSTDGLVDEAHAIVYWQRVRIENNLDSFRRSASPMPPSGVFTRFNDVEETNYGAIGNLTNRFATGSIDHKLTAGGEFIWSETSSYSSGKDNCNTGVSFTCNFLHSNQADMPETDGQTLGLFLEDDMGFMNGEFVLTATLRYDWYEQKPQETDAYLANPNYNGLPDTSSDSKLSPGLRLTWNAAEDVALYAKWSQGFRAPSATELFMDYGAPGTYLRIGNPELKPETSNGFEVGSQFGNEKLGGKISFFNNYYRNFIDQVAVNAADFGVPPGLYPFGVTASVNRAKVHIYGVEVGGQWEFVPGWMARGSLAVVTGKDTDEDVHLNSVAPLKAIVGLSYTTEAWGADLSVTGALGRDDVETANDFHSPAYAVADLTGWWAPSFLDGARIRAGVFNIMDTKYWNALDVPDVAAGASLPMVADYYTEPGRSFRATLIYQF